MSELLRHIPVLAKEVVELLAPSGPMRMIDATLGNGGHTKLLLQADPELTVLGIDRDADAIARAKENLKEFSPRVTLVQSEFSRLAEQAEAHGFGAPDLILMDIGVSSPQIDDPARGFSWREDGPLDMRMDQTSRQTASRILNYADEAELARIFREYGEIAQARRLARFAVERRAKEPFATTTQLAELADAALGRSHGGKLPAPTLVFQALRIAVNDELGELTRALDSAKSLLKSSGRLAVISFHSLEDRIVKHTFREWARGCLCPPGLPICVCHHSPEFRIVTPKAVTASPEETNNNRRSACAKLRVIEKL